MQFVADKLDIDILMEQTCSDHADIAVMESGHLIAEVAEVSHSVAVGCQKFTVSCGGMDG